MATPSKRHLNWTGTSFTPAGGSLTAITGVTDVQIAGGGSVITHSGDGDRFPTTKVNDFADPKITVHCRDLSTLNGFAIGTRGAFASTHNDAKNGITAASGGYSVALAAAIIADKTTGGQHRQFGEGQLMLEAESADGVTNPLTFAAL